MNAPQSSRTDAGFREQLKACTTEDFDGHTAFKELSAEQRIEWLDELIEFVKNFRGHVQTAQSASLPFAPPGPG